jgi:acetyltransferase
VDVLLPILVPQALVDPGDIARAIVESAEKTDQTVLACMVGEQSLKEARQVLHENKVPMSIFPDVPGKVLGAMRRYREWMAKDNGEEFEFAIPDASVIKNLLTDAKPGQALGEAETRPVLAAYGLDLVRGDLATDADQAVKIAVEIGFPVAVKIVSPQILHKSDMGGIALNLGSEEAVRDAIASMHEKVFDLVPDADINGFLVEKMAPEGLEVIVGMRRDPTFGPLMMFGLGGVYVELFKDVGFGVAPLRPKQAKEMILSTKAGHLLQGYRGGPVYDIDAVVDAIGRLSQLALDFPSIAEVEINPLLVLPKGEGAKVLDARMILSHE